jgi:hypothetical protein
MSRLLAAALLLSPLALYAVQQEAGTDGQDLPLAEIGSRGDLYQQAQQRLRERLQRYPQDHEASLLLALIEFKSGYFDEALNEIGGLIKREPKFHLAHLIQGDMLLARTRVVSDIGANALLDDSRQQKDELSLLRQEADARLNAYLDTLPQGRLPRALLALDDEVKSALLVDKRSHRLYVYERDVDGTPRLVQDFYVSTGKVNGNVFAPLFSMIEGANLEGSVEMNLDKDTLEAQFKDQVAKSGGQPLRSIRHDVTGEAAETEAAQPDHSGSAT